MENILKFINDYLILILRILLPFLTLYTVTKCYSCMKHQRRTKRALITLFDVVSNEQIPVLFWENSIGRSRGSDIRLDDSTVSRDHAVLLRREEGWFITDTNSKAGVYLNGKRCVGRTQVYLNDSIALGSTRLILKRGDEIPSFESNQRKPKRIMKPFSLLLISLFTLFFYFIESAFASEGYKSEPFIIFGVYSAVSLLFFVISCNILKRPGFELETLGLFLSGIGLAILVRQDVHQTYVQMISAVLGMIGFLILIKFLEYPDKLKKLRIFIIIGAIGLLAINLIFGSVRSGAQNWIEIGSITVQPSELVKIAFIFVGAATLDVLQTNRNLTEFIIFSAICIGALFLMSDFGTALIFFMTFLIISITRSGDYKTVILAIVAAVFGCMIILYFKPYVADRFSAWGHVWEAYNDGAYQQARVLTYSASGGLFGVGIGNGCLKYIFASENDLVFGILCEELGLIIALTIVIGIISLVFYARDITTLSRSTFYSISACCAAGLFVIQSSLNVFGATDILPLTGVTLPFISLGGSSIISCWGLLAFIKAADERTYKTKRL